MYTVSRGLQAAASTALRRVVVIASRMRGESCAPHRGTTGPTDVYAHTAAFSLGGRGVVIAGHRGRGMTTTLLAGLHRLSADYVTNDRLLLRPEAECGLPGYVWPARLRAGIGTLGALPHLAGLVPEAQRTVPAEQGWSSRPKMPIEPWDFAGCCPATARSSAQSARPYCSFPSSTPTGRR